ncbi:unnamed protein product [Notodromas monacha]|uniref:Uncharacterized protein n=1 Tax=Notodromas monacha TaxID=399045 RepID=A0A7R9BSB3_9CRUS|nr:unnamed protein product [Notodromas monacha]CAG0920779.1 unnamed protein product [Notodromas monacha]
MGFRLTANDLASCFRGKYLVTPRLYPVILFVLIFGVVLTFLNVYELHKVRTSLILPQAEKSEETGLIAWIDTTKFSAGHLQHVQNVFQRIGFKVVSEKPTLGDEMMSTFAHQRVNHFPGSGYFTNKMNLATITSKYIPKAFQLPNGREAALKYSKENPEKMFVLKSNVHRGISVQKIGDIDLAASGKFVQEFVSNPLLIDGHKFDIGVYVAITSVNPLRVYIYEGEVLFRFCPAEYYPFDPVNLDKYVVGDDYLPLWKVPSLSPFYNKLGLGMKDSFNAYLRANGRNDSTWLRDVKAAIQDILLSVESMMMNLITKYPHKEVFFEMTRFDFVLDENLKPFLMEANMSPNLSSKHFPPNRFLYEEVLYNLMSLVGLARHISSDTLLYRSDDEEVMEVKDKDISVFQELCASKKCAEDCSVKECKSFCVHCYSQGEKAELKRAYKEHLNRMRYRRVLPFPMYPSNAKEEFEEKRGLFDSNVWMLRWFRGMCLKDISFCQ